MERGTVTGGTSVTTYPAYRIHEPLNKATGFLASKHEIHFRLPANEDHSIFELSGDGVIEEFARISATAVQPGGYVPTASADPLTASGIVGSATYIFAPSSTKLSSYTPLAQGIEGARVRSSALGSLSKYRYSVFGAPFDTADGYAAGPGDWQNRYGDKRRFFPLVNRGGSVSVVWQDQSNNSIKLTHFGTDLLSGSTVSTGPGCYSNALLSRFPWSQVVMRERMRPRRFRDRGVVLQGRVSPLWVARRARGSGRLPIIQLP